MASLGRVLRRAGLIGAVAVLSAIALPAMAGNGSVSYTYDSLGRVKTATYDTGIIVTYTYDAADNRVTQTVTTYTPAIWKSFNWGSPALW